MAKPRLLVVLALLAAGCVQFEMGPMTTTDTADPPDSTGEKEPEPEVACDPLAQDCPDIQACSLVDGDFNCIEVVTPGGAGDACQGVGECSAGFVCVSATALDGCDGASCCSSLCEVGDGSAQCGSPAETCMPVYGADAPPMWADYGVCRLPD
ncbi:hypothetical protein [Nannocystis sp. SCPEA4]|uniref:hypothetical protein n=1 Tax=Nannocystis sp. SCPEA4 TaxID=2996787 RepID=UPI00226EA16F|nr:hypothetical protein [Nannocystis sp. SCPEA4]MCY1060745.1 hypothetical protein [Nannocystis sp. SCPEA4]